MSVVEEVNQLIAQDIPSGMKHLQDSHNNLEKVAAYCEGNYLQAPDKRHALEETKNYTTQSLASVAYQINTLATNFLHLLDRQAYQLADMESSINHLSQTVMIHKEKVARREIGVLTTNKSTTRPQGVKNPGIVFPEQQERPIKYVRKPIDYNVLDDIGHGVKHSSHMGGNKPRRSSSTSSKASAGSAGQPPTTKPPTPPSAYKQAGGTLSRQTSSPYRTPAPPVSPPSVPSHYAPNYPNQPGPGDPIQGDRRSGYAPVSKGPLPQVQPVPPMGMVQPMQAPPTPPPPPITPGALGGFGSPPLPPPPELQLEMQFTPPPPLMETEYYSEGRGMQYDTEHYGCHRAPLGNVENTWAPKEYIEKVVAIYDYDKDKDDELTFSEGSVIYVIKKNDDGWWEGVMDGVTGLFPGNYVEPCI